MSWTADNLVARVRERLRIPDGSTALSDTHILELADEITRVNIMALLRRTSQEWYVTKYTTPLVANQAEYRLPKRIQAGSVRDVTLVDSDNNEFDLPELLLEHAYTRGGTTGATVRGHLIEGNSVVLRPTPTTADLTLCIRYRIQPSKLLLTTSANAVLLSSGAANVATAQSSLASPFDTSDVDADVVQAEPPFDILGKGTGTGSGSDFTFDDSTTDVSDIVSGDYLCLAGYTPVPQMPPVCQDVLLYGVARIAALELGLARMHSLYEQQYQAAAEAAFQQLNDRNEGANQKIVSPFSPLRQRLGWGWRAG